MMSVGVIYANILFDVIMFGVIFASYPAGAHHFLRPQAE